jgi:RNA polymerase sigma-70 factor (ECF subfamily)
MTPTPALAIAPTASPRADFVHRAARGDQAAFARLVETQVDRSFRTARAILGNDADARDATQDACVSAWRELPNLRDPASFDAWLQRIVVNACRTLLRRRARVHEVSLENVIDRPGAEAAPADQLAEIEVVTRAFDRLDPDKRSILVLHYLEHEPIAAIAASLGLAGGTVKWRLSEARAALNRALVAEGEVRR